MSKIGLKELEPDVVEVPVPEPRKKKTFTNWEVFDKAKIVPVNLRCECLPMHPADEACKTNLLLRASSIVDHLNGGHGGGFELRVRITDGKLWPGWKELSEAGVELHALWCNVCGHSITPSTREIMNHLRPHRGKFRGAFENFRNSFLFHVQFNPPATGDDDAEVEY